MRDLRPVSRAESDSMRDLRGEESAISEGIPPAEWAINRLADPIHFVEPKDADCIGTE